jgi:hypothetical protein
MGQGESPINRGTHPNAHHECHGKKIEDFVRLNVE